MKIVRLAPLVARSTGTERLWTNALVWCLRTFCCVVLFLAIALLLQWRNGAYTSGFGTHPDEPGHYVTALMLFKYVTTAPGTNPMAFAERFYAHYPAVAFGHWPPLFYVVQTVWACLFGLSRSSALILMAVLASSVSLALYYVIRQRFGPVYGIVSGLLFIMLPIVQLHTSMIMAELLLALCTLAAIVAFSRLIESPTVGRALFAGFILSAAILVKGNAWALLSLAVCAPFLARSPLQFLREYAWIPGLCVTVLCAPFTLLTIKMTRDGWDQPWPSSAFFRTALPELTIDHVRLMGWPLILLAGIGVYVSVVRPVLSRRTVDNFWACNLIAIAAALLFHAIVPTSLEMRKIFMSTPSLLLFATAGLSYIVELIPALPRVPRFSYPLLAGLIVGGICLAHPVYTKHPNMGLVAQAVISLPLLDRSAILVASTKMDEREELSFVAEIAERENADFHHAVIRAGKFLAESSWAGADYRLLYSDAQQVEAALRSVPVSAVVLYRGKGRWNGHGALVQDVVNGGGVKLLHMRSEAACSGSIDLFVSPVRLETPVRLPEIDLGRKIGRSILADF